MGKIFYIMGKSSSGKDTIYKHLIEDKEFNFKNIVGYTTRPIRQGEINGKEYYFVTVEGMEELIKAGKVIERRAYDTVHGVWNYFTADDGQIDIDKEDCLLIGTLESYGNVRKYFGEEAVVPIYIYVEDGVRLSRALEREKQQREPKYAEMCRRFLADEADFSEENIKMHNIKNRFENKDLTECVDEIKAFIRSSKEA